VQTPPVSLPTQAQTEPAPQGASHPDAATPAQSSPTEPPADVADSAQAPERLAQPKTEAEDEQAPASTESPRQERLL